jgi:hypothetical protein
VSANRRRFDLTGAGAPRGALLAVALTALALGGCGVGSDAKQTVASAVKTTLSQPLVSRISFSGRVAGAPAVRVDAEAATVFATGLGYARVDLGAATRAKQAIEYLVLLPSTVYLMPISAGSAGLAQGKTWLALPLTRSGRVDAAFPRLAEQLESLSPELLLDELAWGATAARHVGEPVIAHQPLSEYVVTVDLSRAASTAVGASATAIRSAIAEELDALRASRPGATSVPIRVWVDGPGRVARLEAALPGSGLGTITIALSQYGTTILRNLPLAPQVEDVSALVRPGVKLPGSPLAIGLR